MYIIGICDDEVMYREQLKELCHDYFLSTKTNYECIEFASGEEVLKYQGGRMHLLFLDVELTGISGIELLHKMEQTESVWRIVFVSGHEEVVWDCFGIKTLGFVRKPIAYQQIEHWLSTMEKENRSNQIILLEVGNRKIACYMDEIYLFEATRNYTTVYYKNIRKLLNGNLKAWERKVMGSDFVRVHKSYLINLKYVKEYGTDKVVMKNGMEIPIGRKFGSMARERFFDYVKEG